VNAYRAGESNLILPRVDFTTLISDRYRWAIGYKSGYNREVLRRSVTRNPLRNLVEPMGDSVKNGCLVFPLPYSRAFGI
jgi:hypothetical protein